MVSIKKYLNYLPIILCALVVCFIVSGIWSNTSSLYQGIKWEVGTSRLSGVDRKYNELKQIVPPGEKIGIVGFPSDLAYQYQMQYVLSPRVLSTKENLEFVLLYKGSDKEAGLLNAGYIVIKDYGRDFKLLKKK